MTWPSDELHSIATRLDWFGEEENLAYPSDLANEIREIADTLERQAQL